MRYEHFIGLRYLMAKRRKGVLSIITMISVAGVALGVTALIVVLSVMGGFKKDLKEKIIGTKAHIVVKAKEGEFLTDYEPIVESSMKDAEVIGAAAFLESEVMVSSPTNLSGVMLRGVNPDQVVKVTTLGRDVVEGKLEYLVDSEPMMEALEKARGKELDELLKRMRKERIEMASESENDLPPLLKAEEPEEDRYGEDGFMPGIPGVDDQPAKAEPKEGDDRFGEEGFMPGIPGVEVDDEPAEPAKPRIPGLIVGKELSKSLQIELGDEINVVTPKGEMGPTGPIPRSRPFRVVGVFYSGMYEFDANYAYAYLPDVQSFLNQEGVSGIEMKTSDVEKAPEIADRIQLNMPDTLSVLDWQELNRSLFYALKLEKIAMFVVLTFIILVASFSIVAMLIMIVIEKGREIAILKAIGATNAGVMRTFIFQGTVIGVVGAVLGLIFGLLICFFLAEFGFPLNSEVYYISTLPVSVDPVEIIAVVVAAVVISLLATIYPSIQAARLNPVDGLRDD